jgi:Protein of unknown function (DUF3631)/VirE N-terminal domain
MAAAPKSRIKSEVGARPIDEEKESQDVYTGSNIRVSTVKDAVSTATQDCEAVEIINSISGGKYRAIVQHIRNTYQDVMTQTNGDRKAAKRAVAAEKKKLPGVLWCGRFSHREDKALACHSGLLCADLDSLGDGLVELRPKLLTSPYLWAMFSSPTGDGLKCVFRVKADGQAHQASFRAVAHHVRELIGVEIDKSCSNVSRLCFVSDDHETFLNLEAKELPGLTKPTEEAAPVSTVTARVPAYHSASLRQKIAQELLGEIKWKTDTVGYCDCPGRHLHTSPDGTRDCEVYLDGTPTIHCFHNSCDGIRKGINRELRLRIARAKCGASDDRLDGAFGDKSAAAKITYLASLSPLEYERCRKEEAKRLGCRESVLDGLVSDARQGKNATNLAVQGSAVIFPEVELWPGAVGGPDVLNELAETFRRYIALPTGAADALALWCAHAHAFKAFICSPRLNISSPEKGCGKTTLRDVVGLFVPRAVATENLSVAVLFRLVDAHAPTILADEYDSWIRDNEELRGLLNAGHRRGARVYRCEGEGKEVRGFDAYAPAVLCGIGTLPGTLHDRSIIVRLERAKPGELHKRFDPRHTEREQKLYRQLARWVADNFLQLEAADPLLPDDVFNRLADNWRPLFAIAAIAGGDWLERCAAAFAKLTSYDDTEAQGFGVMLLKDIQQVFLENGFERIFSKNLVELLNNIKDSPWPEVRYGKGISERWLARHVGQFEIHPKTLRIGDQRAKGYEVASFTEVFERYIPARGETKRDNVTSLDDGTSITVTTETYVTDGESTSTFEDQALSRCHTSTAPVGANGNDSLEEGAEGTVTVDEELWFSEGT